MQKPNLEVLIKEHTAERERLLKLDAINDFYKSPESAPVKKIIKESKAKFSLIDATHGRKTMSVIITDSENVILSYLDLKQIAAKFNVEVDDER